tara:strand:+ start:369 stop:575 length:207 start_codon:yes stop_codon:yes gene_type:complete
MNNDTSKEYIAMLDINEYKKALVNFFSSDYQNDDSQHYAAQSDRLRYVLEPASHATPEHKNLWNQYKK